MVSDWPMVPLGEVLTKSEEWIEIQPDGQYRQVTVRLWGGGVVLRNEVSGTEIAAKRRLVVRSQQFILSRIDARNGAFGLVPDFLNGAVVSNDFPTFNIDREQILPRFLEWMSNTRGFVDLCKAASEGTTNRVRLKIDRFLATEIPLPPLDEQRRIVARIEELAALIEEAWGLRREAREEMKALLASAKNEIFNEELRDKWPAVTLGEVADIGSGVTLGRSLSGPTIQLPYLRVANVQDGYLDLREVKEVEIRASEREKWLLQPGDILLTEGGDWDKLGRGTVWHGEIPNCIHQNHIFRVRVDPDEFVPEYLSALVGSPYGKAYFQAASKQTTNLATINKRQLKAFVVLRPPLSKQHRIVAYLDGLQAQVDELTALQDATQAELDSLLPSVLDRAFKGEL
ncbi:MAG: restriction endonuclease subunit S [Anaerolineales bacterium]|nr:MAG: restriction endonuclease subunit S [Anaerolineales bacterium]